MKNESLDKMLALAKYFKNNGICRNIINRVKSRKNSIVIVKEPDDFHEICQKLEIKDLLLNKYGELYFSINGHDINSNREANYWMMVLKRKDRVNSFINNYRKYNIKYFDD